MPSVRKCDERQRVVLAGLARRVQHRTRWHACDRAFCDGPLMARDALRRSPSACVGLHVRPLLTCADSAGHRWPGAAFGRGRGLLMPDQLADRRRYQDLVLLVGRRHPAAGARLGELTHLRETTSSGRCLSAGRRRRPSRSNFSFGAWIQSSGVHARRSAFAYRYGHRPATLYPWRSNAPDHGLDGGLRRAVGLPCGRTPSTAVLSTVRP
jgi:hypothetical protein